MDKKIVQIIDVITELKDNIDSDLNKKLNLITLYKNSDIVADEDIKNYNTNIPNHLLEDAREDIEYIYNKIYKYYKNHYDTSLKYLYNSFYDRLGLDYFKENIPYIKENINKLKKYIQEDCNQVDLKHIVMFLNTLNIKINFTETNSLSQWYKEEIDGLNMILDKLKNRGEIIRPSMLEKLVEDITKVNNLKYKKFKNDFITTDNILEFVVALEKYLDWYDEISNLDIDSLFRVYNELLEYEKVMTGNTYRIILIKVISIISIISELTSDFKDSRDSIISLIDNLGKYYDKYVDYNRG